VRNWRLIVAVLVALATVGIVGALTVRGADEAGRDRTLKDVSNSVADDPASGGIEGDAGVSTAGAEGGPAVVPGDTGSAAVPGGASAAGDSQAEPVPVESGQAASYLPVSGLSVPQTYRCSVDVIGWRDREAGLAEVRVVSAELLGPIDPATGQATGKPEDPTLGRSGYVEGRTLLVTVTGAAATDLPGSGPAKVHLVFVPSGEGAVFWIDRVIE